MRQNILRTVLLSGAGVLLVAGIVVAALLLWPASREPEQNATLAAPAEVIENTASDETTPKPEPQPEQKPAPEETPAITPTPAEDEKKEPLDPLTVHRFWETVPEMSREEAIPIITEKLTRIEEPLTDKERMAFYIWAQHEFEHYVFYADYNASFGLEVGFDPSFPEEEVLTVLDRFELENYGVHAYGSETIYKRYVFPAPLAHDDVSLPNGEDTQIWVTINKYIASFHLYDEEGQLVSLDKLPLKALLRYLLSFEFVRIVDSDVYMSDFIPKPEYFDENGNYLRKGDKIF